MKREIEKLKSEEFDLLVIGGGIHGATIVYEAALAGLKVCLIEKDDFGSQTSANSLKVLHGGLRYLQHGNIKRMRESIYSRKAFQKIAPHLVKSVPFMIPTNGFAIKSKLALNIALKLNDIISFDRNKGIAKECHIPTGKTVSKIEAHKIYPKLDGQKITGGAVWYESIALNTERMLFEFLHDAYDNGAVLANYVKAIKFNSNEEKITSVNVVDERTNEEFSIKAKSIVNSVGPWLNEILSCTKDLKYLKSPLSQAVNIIVKKKLFNEYAVGFESVKEFVDKAAIISKGKRLFFFVPLGEYTMIGTTYKVFNKKPDDCKIEKNDVIEIINEVNDAYKRLNLTYDDVTQTHIGTQATADVEFKNDFDVQPETHSLVFDHSEKGNYKNLISIRSVKYTTAPAIARDVLKIVDSKNGIQVGENIHKNDNTNFISSEKQKFLNENHKYSSSLLSRLWTTYGKRGKDVLEYIAKSEKNKEVIFENEEVLLGEILYNYEFEMGLTSEDIISRRIGLNSLEKVDEVYFNKIKIILQNINN